MAGTQVCINSLETKDFNVNQTASLYWNQNKFKKHMTSKPE